MLILSYLLHNKNAMNVLKNRKFINIFIIAINVLFVGGLVLGEWQYIHSSRMQTIKANKDSFVGTNTSLSSMTSNYLVGESHLCRSWSNFLNSEAHDKLTIEEANCNGLINDDIMNIQNIKAFSNQKLGCCKPGGSD